MKRRTYKSGPIFPLILAGGASSRLFPFNKVLSDLRGKGKTLLAEAADRADALAPRARLHILTVGTMAPLIQKALRLPAGRLFVDPARRGTWPALLWAMAHLRRTSPEAVLAVMTADHVIPRTRLFAQAARRACQLAAEQPAIVMTGVEPSRDAAAWTGFGAFRTERLRRSPLDRSARVAVCGVTEFTEKPSRDRASEMIRQGGWQWNSGMFFFRISTAEKALREFQPAMSATYERLCSAVAAGDRATAERCFALFPEKIPHPAQPERQVDNTIDFAIMTPLVRSLLGLQHPEPAIRIPQSAEWRCFAVVGGLPDWADIGQWAAVRTLLQPDRAGNVALGHVRATACRRSILAAGRGWTLQVEGLRDAVIAVSGSGLLALPLDRLADIKTLVASAAEENGWRTVVAVPGAKFHRRGSHVHVRGLARA